MALMALGLAAVNIAGATYYLSPLGRRVRDPLHPLFRPSGTIGQSLGIVAAVLFLFLWLYPLRKRFGPRASFTGGIAGWLDWHVAAGLLVPWIAATHAGWRFKGMIGLGYLALFIVYLSGLVGRYLYVRIPRRRSGAELTRDEVTSEREKLLFEITARTGLSPAEVRETLAPDVESTRGRGPIGTIFRMVSDDRARRRAARQLARRTSAKGAARRIDPRSLAQVLALARQEMALAQQIRMLEATQRLFRWWHVLHKPVAITAFIAVVTHIAVAVAVGATWFH